MEIGGRAADGRPKLRLVWGQSPDSTVFWQGRQRLRYLAGVESEFVCWREFGLTCVRDHPPTPEPPQCNSLIVEKVWEEKDIGIPRWFIEQFMPSTIACEGWEEIQFDLEEDKTLIDSMGPAPKDGFFEEAFYMIADHGACCEGMLVSQGCLGAYRAPASHDIAYVKWLLQQLQDEAYSYHWEDVPPPEVVAQALSDRKSEGEQRRMDAKEEIDYGIRNSLLSIKGKRFGVTPITVPDLQNIFQRARKF